MFALTRAGFAVAIAAALFAVAPFSAKAADKPFVDSDLADSAVQLEGQIKSDAGAATKPVAQIRKDADAAFAKNDFRTGMTLLGQIVAAQPNDATTWLRLARTVMQIRPVNDQERATLLERASTAAYIAYERTTNRNEEADSLAFLGDVMSQRQLWRPALDALRLSLDIREAANVRGQYERLRDQYGFRVLDYSVDADTASPRACFQFSEDLPARTDFSPFVVLAGTDKPAISTADKQLCVEGLKHGDSYTVTLARRTAVGGARVAVEIVGLRHLCARPQARGAVLVHGLCAAAHRAARHSGDQRQHQIGRRRDLPHQRPQSGRYHRRRDQLRQRQFSKEPRPLRYRAAQGKPRRAGLERRSRRRQSRRSIPTSPRRFRSTRRSAI